jgi:hypothetical protein
MRIRDPAEGRDFVPRPEQRSVGKQAAILAEGDEDDAIHQLLRDADGLVKGLVVRRSRQIPNERAAIPVVIFVERIANLSLSLV